LNPHLHLNDDVALSSTSGVSELKDLQQTYRDGLHNK
jgi:hypothetical protein